MAEDKQLPQQSFSLPDYCAITCFFISGFTSLVYEICWIRKASLVFGATTFAVSTVTAIFFAGMALGSYVFGRYTLKTNKPLRIYAILEIVLGILVFLNPALFFVLQKMFTRVYPFLYQHFLLLSLVRLLVCAVLFLPPTVLIGGTLPLFCRQYVRIKNHISRSVGLLYAINTLGAAVGCALCGLYILPCFGMNKTVVMGGIVNISIGVIMYILKMPPVRYLQKEKKCSPHEPAADAIRSETFLLSGSRYRAGIALLFFFNGFVALGNEILWTRFLSLIVHNTVFTYTITLTTILAGIVIGSLIVALISGKIRHCAFIFGIISMVIGISVLSSMMLPVSVWNSVRDTHRIATLILIVILVFPVPSLLSGMAFPLAIRMVVGNPVFAGVGVGKMTAVNTIGGVFGALGVGFILVPVMGLQKSVLLTTGISIGIGCLAIGLVDRHIKITIKTAVITAGTVIWCAVPLLSPAQVPAGYLAEEGRLIDFREGVGGHLAVVKNRYDVPVLEIDRMWQGEERVSHQIMAAHVPMILHQNPEQILVIGVGVGQTASRFLYYPMKKLDCIDIEKELFTLIRDYFDSEWMDDNRVQCIIEDGRNFVSHTDRKYDIISVETGQLFRPGCASFYTSDFYQSAKRKLKRNGLLCQFIPIVFLDTREFLSVIHTFIEVFPNNVLWYNRNEFLLIGSADTQPVLTDIRLRIVKNNTLVSKDLTYYYWGGPKNSLNNPDVFAAGFLSGPKSLFRLTTDAQTYTDDKPLLEYATADVRRKEGGAVNRILHQVMKHLDNPKLIFSDGIPDTVSRKISHIRQYNLRNITAMRLFRFYLEGGNEQYLLRAYTQNPYNYDFAFQLGELAAKNNNIAGAEDYFRRTLTVYPEHGNAHYNLGLMLLKQGKVDSALHHFNETTRLIPGHAEAGNNIGVILAQNEQYEKALEYFTQAIESKPGYTSALKNRERVLEIINKKKGIRQ